MRIVGRAFAGVLLTILVLVPAAAHADTVQLTLHDGRLSLVANNATPAQIFDAWSRAGGVLIVNADRIPSAPLTLTLENVPEEQALDTLLRPVTGYLAQRRTAPGANASVFDRIVIVPTPAAAAPPPASAVAGRPATPAPAPQPGPAFTPPVFPQAPPPAAATQQRPPNAIPQAPGVSRLVGPDGQPVEDDQAGAPQTPYTPGDAPDRRQPVPPQRFAPPPQPAPAQPQQPSSGAPAGAPRPGMVVPAPTQQQPTQR